MPSCNPWGNTPIGVWIVGSETGGGSQVAVTNWPETQAVSGSVNATCTGTVAVSGSVAVTGTFWPATQPVSGPLTDAQLRAAAVPVTGSVSATCSGTVAVSNFPATQPVSAAALPLPTGASSETTLSALNAKVTACNTGAVTVASSALPTGAATEATLATLGRASVLCVTATGAAGAAVTLNLPAVGGQFHYITQLMITRYATAAVTGTATPILVTSTNLPGNPVWTFARAQAIGTTDIQGLQLPGSALRSAAANTQTQIVCPGTTSVLWRVTAFYYAAP